MDSLDARLLRSLSSETRLEVIRLLKEGIDHPGDLAKEVGVVRQAIDKHLLDMYSMGLVDRSAHFPPTGRPKIVYSLTPRGANLYNSINKLIMEFSGDMRAQHAELKRELDTKLIMGQIGEKGYRKKLEELDSQFSVLFD